MSTHPNIIGRSQFPNPPIAIGITIKKIIIKACAVTILLYNCSSPKKEPAVPNSVRITKDIPSPTNPDQIPKMKYKVPISLWLVDTKKRVNFSMKNSE
jgi:hypothetical protein